MERLNVEDSAARFDRCYTHTIQTTRRNPTAKAIAAPMVDGRAGLRDAVAHHKQKLREQVEATAEVTIIDWEGDDLVREINAEADQEDRRNPALGLKRTVFPDGLEVVVARRGEEQATRLEELAGRLDSVKEKAPDFVARYQPQLASAITETNEAAAAQAAAFKAVGSAKSAIDLVKARLSVQYEAVYSALRGAFAANPGYVERYFIRPGGTSRRVDEDELDDETKDEAA